MADPRLGVVEQPGPGQPVLHADAELGLLAPGGVRPDAADALAEAADLPDHVEPEGHVGPDEVPHRPGPDRRALVRAADDPVELLGEPGRAALGPVRGDASAARHDAVGVEARQPAQPLRPGDRVVVEERDDVRGGRRHARVAGAGETGRGGVRDRPHAVQLPLHAVVERLVPVGHHDDLGRGQRLEPHGLHRRGEVVPAVLRVGADDDGDRRRAHPLTLP